jgi:hypothetical protein
LFIGTLEQLKDIDNTLYKSFNDVNTKYVAAINLVDRDGNAIGIFGVCWNEEISLDEFKPKIEKYLYEDRGILQSYVQPQLVNAEIK